MEDLKEIIISDYADKELSPASIAQNRGFSYAAVKKICRDYNSQMNYERSRWISEHGWHWYYKGRKN